MNRPLRKFSAAAALLLVAAPAGAAAPVDPLRFFEGRTETAGTMKLMFKKPYGTHSLGRGRIEPDGTLVLVQQVREDSKPMRERQWRIRRTGRGHYSGTMSEATGPVTIDQLGSGYRFRFRMKGNLSVEQWLTPLAGGMAATNRLTIRKFGMTVGTSEGMVRKLSGHADLGGN
jgi:hypothetical protein